MTGKGDLREHRARVCRAKTGGLAGLVLLLAACGAPMPPPADPVVATAAEPVCVRLLFAGDLMQHLPQVDAARREGGFDYGDVFEYLRPRFAAADIAVVNLETTLTRSGHYTGYPCFRSPVAVADAMRDVGVDVAVLANNHCCDGGAEGVRTTIAELSRRGIRHTGVFADSLDRRSNNPLYMKVRGVTFALLNYTYGTNGIPVPRGVCVNGIDTVRMAADLAAARRDSADCIVVCMHWGNEYERRENSEQRRLAAFLRRHGADVVVGSHPHVIQPFEADSAHAVFYSLGNFVSNQQRRYCDGGLLAGVEATLHPDGRMTCRAEAVPVWVLCPGYRIVPPEVGDTLRMPAWSRTRYEQFLSDVQDSVYK